MTFRNAIGSLTVVAACLLAATAASAQPLPPPTQRPSQGLFGRAPKGEGLDVSVSGFRGYDDDQHGEGVVLPGSTTEKGGQFDGLDLSATFKKAGRRIAFGAAEQSSVRYYPALENLMGVRHNVTGGFTAQIDRTQITASQVIGYTPFYTYSSLPALFDAQPGEMPAPSDPILVRRPAVTFGTSGGLSQTLGRATFSVSASTQHTAYVESTQDGLRADTLAGRFLYHLNRDVGIVGGYRYQRGRYGYDPGSIQSFDAREYELGIDYNRALSLTRRTTIGFATGTTAVGGVDGSSNYRLIGDARISRELGRTWMATGSIHRGVGLLAGFNQPIFSDAVAMSVGGSMSSRLTVSVGGGYSAGELTTLKDSNSTTNYSGSARMQVALTRIMALSGEFRYYRYAFDGTAGLPDAFPQRLERRTAQIGLSLWVPLFR